MVPHRALSSVVSASLAAGVLTACSIVTYDTSDGSHTQVLGFADGRATPDLRGKASVVRVQTLGLSRSVFGTDFGVTTAEYTLLDKSCGIVVSRRQGEERTAFFDETGCEK